MENKIIHRNYVIAYMHDNIGKSMPNGKYI